MNNFEIMTNHLTSAFTNNVLKSKRNAQRDENTVILKWKQNTVSTRYHKCSQDKRIYESKYMKLSCSQGNN